MVRNKIANTAGMAPHIFVYVGLAIILSLGCRVERPQLAKNVGTEMVSTKSQASPTVSPDPSSVGDTDDELRKWSATINGTVFDWNGEDLFLLTAAGDKVSVFSLIARDYCLTLQKGSHRNCYCGHSFRLSSVVGGIVSFDHESDFSCQGSYLSWRYGSIDVNKSGLFRYPRLVEFETDGSDAAKPSKMIGLQDLFSDRDIYTALSNNDTVKRAVDEAVGRKKLNEFPKSLDQLSRFLHQTYCGLGGSFYLDSDYLTRFAFHHLVADKVAIWISLTPDSHAGQADQEHIELVLPITEKIRAALLLADSKKEGFLLKDAPEFVGTTYAEFEFKAGKAVKEQ